MKVLLGSTNPSKRKYFEELLRGCPIEYYTPDDLDIVGEPEETGKSPEENAVVKARYYGQFFDRVICNDSGLYFRELPLEDKRQPGLHIRTPFGGRRLDDEEMIRYYGKLIQSLGGRVTASYHNGYAVSCHGRIFSCTDCRETYDFYMVDTPSPQREDGWPLDSLSVDRNTGRYFVEEDDIFDDLQEVKPEDHHREVLVRFLKDALGLEEK